MENDIVTSKIERSEVWIITIVVTLFTLLVVFVVIATFWDQLCARIMINALEYGMEQTLTPRYGSAIPPIRDRRPASRRPSTPKYKTLEEKMEEFKADLERFAPSETLDELLNRLDRERRELEPEWEKFTDVNE